MLIKSMLNGPLGIAREMDRLFDAMVASEPAGAFRARWSFPAINLWEDENNLHAQAELPGMTMEDIEVLVTDGELTLKGQRRYEVPEGAKPLRRERAMGQFERTITLPVQVDVENAEAHLVDGVLSITLPKAPAFQPRRIAIRSGVETS